MKPRPSIVSRLVLLLLRLFVRRRIKPDMDVVAERARLTGFDKFSKALPSQITVQSLSCSEVFETTVVSNANRTGERVILYLHGGGFIWEMPGTYQSFVASMCLELNANAVIPWYRLAPEHPYPAAPEDCLACYRSLLETVAPENIVLMGDSAGGNLVLATLLRIRQENLAMPRCGVLLSPVTDLADQSSSWILNGWSGRDPLFPADAFALLRHYCGDTPRTEPLMSPYYADLSGLPALLFMVGDTESLLEDSISVAKQARAKGVEAELQVWRGMPHVFPLLHFLPEARRARREIRNFVLRQFEGKVTPSSAESLIAGLR
jgi:epsilon-lactone hydrolase